eukprot:GHRQ01031299.1.p3 GENE.GHRQ01031299.1~~GHRQ01031299.1.p3  ORF type:complete len:107 (+),score=13.70 GHRQ01031299.1:468-788(+)
MSAAQLAESETFASPEAWYCTAVVVWFKCMHHSRGNVVRKHTENAGRSMAQLLTLELPAASMPAYLKEASAFGCDCCCDLLRCGLVHCAHVHIRLASTDALHNTTR